MHLRAAAVNASNYFELIESEHRKYEGVDGVDFRLLSVLAKALKFTFEVVVPEDGGWGSKNPDGSWTGMVSMLMKNEADLAIDVLSINDERSQVVDYTFPYSVDGDAFVMKKAGTAPMDFFFIHPFDWPIWVAFIISLFICAILLACIEHMGLEKNDERREKKTAFAAAEILIGNGLFGKFCERGFAKIFFTFSALPIRILMFSFSGLLLSFLMSPIMEHQIATIKELAHASKAGKIKVTVLANAHLELTLMSADTGDLRDLSENIRRDPSSLVSDSSAVGKIVKGYVFMETRDYATMMIYRQGLTDEELFISEDSLKLENLAMLLRKNFCCREKFSKMIMRVHQAGIYKKILRDQLFKIGLKTKLEKVYSESDQGVKPIPLPNLIGVFGILIPGYGLAALQLLRERYMWKASQKKKPKKNPRKPTRKTSL